MKIEYRDGMYRIVHNRHRSNLTKTDDCCLFRLPSFDNKDMMFVGFSHQFGLEHADKVFSLTDVTFDIGDHAEEIQDIEAIAKRYRTAGAEVPVWHDGNEVTIAPDALVSLAHMGQVKYNGDRVELLNETRHD